jgi:flagellar protein FlaJ
MALKTEQRHIIAIIIGMLIIILDFIFLKDTVLLVPIIAIGLTVAWMQYWIDFFAESARQRAIEERFPDFVRNLVGTIKSGMPVSKAIQHVADTDYGALTPYVTKLAYKVEWGIPVHKAFLSFAESTENPIIKRAVSTVIESEISGGNLEDVLDSITDSLISIKKIKDKRKASIHSQVMQSYIIFFVFLGVMIVIQNLLIPYISELQGAAGEGGEMMMFGSGGGSALLSTKVKIDFSSPITMATSFIDWLMSLYGIFMMLALIQGLFAGLVIGKLSEGHMRFGLKHSLLLMTIAFLVMSLAQAL